MIFNRDPSNQLRFVTSLRTDYYQIPYDPNPNDLKNAPSPGNGFAPQYPSIGLRDGQHEGDAFVNFLGTHLQLQNSASISPLYHYNSANYDSSPNDVPIASTDHRASTYAGGQVAFSANVARNNLETGLYSFYQRDNELVGQFSTTEAAIRRLWTESIPQEAWSPTSWMTNSSLFRG